jgi:glutamate carboxypeptidase
MTSNANFLIAQDLFLKELEHYCRIRSGTSNFYGVNEAQNFLIRSLQSMGFVSQLLNNSSERKSGQLLIARRYIHEEMPTVIFVSHADTLDGADLDQSRYVLQLTDKKIVGQGVLDDKASQFVALRGIAQYLEQGNTQLNLIFVSSPNEELGSYGFQETFQKLALEADLVLGFEPALDAKDLVISRRGNRWYNLEIEGREAHSGRAHKEGINAVHEMAFIISKLHRLTNYKKDVNVNVGEVQTSSHTYNVVCGRAHAKIDTRFSDMKSRDDLHKKILKVFNKRHVRAQSDKKECKITWSIADDCPPLQAEKISVQWARRYVDQIQSIEKRNIELKASGGGADVCYFHRKGLIVIDGLGACGQNMHRSDECVFIESLWTRSQALSKFLEIFQSSFHQS